RVLRAAGIEPLVRPSGVDETVVLRQVRAEGGTLTPADEALVLARAKAEAVAPRVSGLVLLGCDSVLELDGTTYGKPVGPDEAIHRWRLMRGRSGVLHTGHWVIDRRSPVGPCHGDVASTTVHFAEVTDAEIAAYVATGEPLGVAGAFTIDGLGGAFVEWIEGDPANVVGLSLPLLRRLLSALDLSWTDLWSRLP
ncbi:MAG TPA: nucleoside triphosphate pyrophosphatase, partial [Jiangellaceae bacterium]